MSKILFTWELGDGNGHVMPYVDLISRLVAQGHEVHFSLRSLHKAYDLLNDTGVIWHQAPLVLPRHVEVMMPIDSYAKILHHAGYDNPRRLSGLIMAWKNLYALINPDLILFDFSPTAMLAARSGRAKRIAIGSGFHIPPNTFPIPPLKSDSVEKYDEKEVLDFETRVLKIINSALELTGMQPISQLGDLFHADEIILRTLPELDHYTGRAGASYAGIMKSPSGEIPVWPSCQGPRVFAYLKYFEALPVLLGFLSQRRYPTLVYGDKIPEEIIRRFSSDTLIFVKNPLDMDAIGHTTDIAITNAGHGSSAELLLAGVPLLLLPLNGEQCLVANNVERLGAGLSAPKLQPAGIQSKLERLIKDPTFRENAKKFSKSYTNKSATNLTDTMMRKINEFIPLT